MSNNKQQTAVEWFSQRAYELFEQYSEGKFDRITLNKLMLEATDKAKEMEKKQIENAYQAGQDNVDYTACLVDEDGLKNYYNETYGGNK
jgi:hypothetical protein